MPIGPIGLIHNPSPVHFPFFLYYENSGEDCAIGPFLLPLNFQSNLLLQPCTFETFDDALSLDVISSISITFLQPTQNI